MEMKFKFMIIHRISLEKIFLYESKYCIQKYELKFSSSYKLKQHIFTQGTWKMKETYVYKS